MSTTRTLPAILADINALLHAAQDQCIPIPVQQFATLGAEFMAANVALLQAAQVLPPANP